LAPAGCFSGYSPVFRGFSAVSSVVSPCKGTPGWTGRSAHPSGCRRHSASAPKGRREHSPGRKPWVCQPAKPQSPVGASDISLKLQRASRRFLAVPMQLSNAIRALQAAEKTPVGPSYVTGHDFSRAVNSPKTGGASAPEEPCPRAPQAESPGRRIEQRVNADGKCRVARDTPRSLVRFRSLICLPSARLERGLQATLHVADVCGIRGLQIL